MARSLCGTSEEAEGREWELSWAETSPEAGSTSSLQPWGPPCEVQAGSPRLAAQVQRYPSTTTLLRGGCTQPSGGGPDTHPSIPWQGSAPWGLGADLGLRSIWGLSWWAVGTLRLWARESTHPSAGVREESRCSHGARGGLSGGLTRPPNSRPALVDLEQESCSPGTRRDISFIWQSDMLTGCASVASERAGR